MLEVFVARVAAIAAVALALAVMAPAPASAEEVKIKHASGNGSLTLNADLELAPGKDLSQGVVLIVHGTLAHKDMEITTALQAMLKERGHSSLAINLALGVDDRHGMYDCARPHTHLDGDTPAEIQAWVDWLKAKGAGAITLLGHSRGGNQAARYAAGKPDPAIARVALVAPPTLSPGNPASGYERAYKKDLAPILARARALVGAGKGATLLKDVDFLYCPKTSVTAATFVDYYRDNPERDTPSVIKRIKLPVLAVAGGDDRINRHFAKRMKGHGQANVKLVVVEDAGHFFRDLYGEDLADAVAAFAGDPGS